MTRASETSMSNEQRRATAFKPSVRSRQLSRVVITRAYLATKKNTRKIQEKDEKRKEKWNQYARVRRYKITSTLGLLVRGDPQSEGLRGLQPRALGSKLDYFHAGITSTRLHRRSVFLLSLLSVSGGTVTLTLSLFCMHRSGCSYCDASGEWVCLPSLRLESESSALLLRVSIKKKKKSPHDSQFIQANVRQPFQVPLDSAFDRLKMNSSRPSARYHSRWRSWR